MERAVFPGRRADISTSLLSLLHRPCEQNTAFEGWLGRVYRLSFLLGSSLQTPEE